MLLLRGLDLNQRPLGYEFCVSRSREAHPLRVSEATLHERINLKGPRDELKELAGTFDGMLERLDAAFASQRRFVANASHELRTPLSIIRTELDVALANPRVTRTELLSMAKTVLEASERSERLIESLLTLARSDAGARRVEPVDLAEVAGEVVDQLGHHAQALGVRMESSLTPAAVEGERGLLDRLVANLVENAIRIQPSGRLDRGVHHRLGPHGSAAGKEQWGDAYRPRGGRVTVRALPPTHCRPDGLDTKCRPRTLYCSVSRHGAPRIGRR
jgi:signal transduction histidine kinase